MVDQFNTLTREEREIKGSYWIKCLKNKKHKLVGPCFPANLISFLVMAKQAFNYIKFTDLSFSGANLVNAVFYHCDFIRINFTKSVIYNSIFIDCIFEEVNMTEIKLESDSHKFQQKMVNQFVFHQLIDICVVLMNKQIKKRQ